VEPDRSELAICQDIKDGKMVFNSSFHERRFSKCVQHTTIPGGTALKWLAILLCEGGVYFAVKKLYSFTGIDTGFKGEVGIKMKK